VIFDGGLAAAPLAGPLPAGAPLSTGMAAGTPDAPSVTLSGAATLLTPYLLNQSLTLAGSAAAPAVASIRPKAFGGQTSVLTALSIPTTGGTAVGRLDLADTALVLDYAATDPSPIVTVRDLLAGGFHRGD